MIKFSFLVAGVGAVLLSTLTLSAQAAPSKPMTISTEQVVKSFLDSHTLPETKQIIDLQDKSAAPTARSNSRHRQLDGVLIMGGSEVLPM